jgi:hypothetical protein
MKVLATAIILPSITAATPALAQDNKPPAICWEILSPAQGVSPHSVLKVNKCTGETWILTRTSKARRFGLASATAVKSSWPARGRVFVKCDSV